MESEQQIRTRPESIAARNFSEDLDSLFGLHSGTTIGNLSETVQKKKRNVSTHQQELADLELRIREAEERLAHATGSSPTGSEQLTASSSPPETDTRGASDRQTSPGAQGPPTSRAAYRRAQSIHQFVDKTLPDRQVAANYVPGGSRPSNTRAESFTPHIPGAMPMTPTPRFEGGDYVTVDRSR